MKLQPDFKEFLRLLLSHRVRFVIVGAHALAAHGKPRFTGDIDVLVDPTRANAARLLAALTDFGFGAIGLRVEDFTEPDRVAQLGYPPVRIDLRTGISGVTFREAWAGRVATRLGGLDVAVLGVREFLKNKRAAGRPKDLADIALLEEGTTVSVRPRTTEPKPRRANPRRKQPID
jgi:hypothetical protein